MVNQICETCYSVKADKVLHSAAFHFGFPCLSKYKLTGFQSLVKQVDVLNIGSYVFWEFCFCNTFVYRYFLFM